MNYLGLRSTSCTDVSYNSCPLLLFFRYDIVTVKRGNVNQGALGIASVASICKPSENGEPLAVSVVELKSFYSDIACAHELGHKLVKIILQVLISNRCAKNYAATLKKIFKMKAALSCAVL